MAARIPNLASVREFASKNPHWPEPTLRDLIYHSVERLNARGETIPANGFAPCIIRIDGRVRLDIDAFALFIERGRMAPLRNLERAEAV